MNLADDDVLFAVFTERDFNTYQTLADPSEGDHPSENTFNPTFLGVESISFHDGKMTIAFKDSEKKYMRNLAHVRI